MSGLSDRLKDEPEYRPYCIHCSTMMRMKLEPDGRTMWCAPVRDNTHDGLAQFGLGPAMRWGCGLRFDIETGEKLEPRTSLAPLDGGGPWRARPQPIVPQNSAMAAAEAKRARKNAARRARLADAHTTQEPRP